MTSSSGSIFCQNGSQNSGSHFTYIYWFIIKDMNEQPDEVVRSVRSRRVPVKQEGRGQDTTFKRMTQPQEMIKTGQNQLGPRWWTVRLPVDLEHIHIMNTFIVIHQLNDTPTSAMTVLRPTIKGQKVGGGPIPRNPQPLPKIVGIILPLISL